MGSTILTRLAATTFVGQPDGAQYIALWEECYEQNVYPHTPSWGCRYFGHYAGAIDMIFAAASACEGGAFRTKSGTMKPERYIARWHEAFNAATVQPDVHVDVAFGSGIYEITSDAEPAIRSVCAENGLPGAVVQVGGSQTPRLRFQLSDKGGAALCADLSQRGNPGYVTVWKMLRGGPHTATCAAPVLIPAHLQSDQECTTEDRDFALPTAYALLPAGERDYLDHLVIHRDGSVVIEWPYSHIGCFATTTAKDAELKERGSGAPLISRFRDALAQAAIVPDSLRLRIVRDPDVCTYRESARSSFDALVAATAANGFGVLDAKQQALSIQVKDLRACNALTKLRQLVRGQISVKSKLATRVVA